MAHVPLAEIDEPVQVSSTMAISEATLSDRVAVKVRAEGVVTVMVKGLVVVPTGIWPKAMAIGMAVKGAATEASMPVPDKLKVRVSVPFP